MTDISKDVVKRFKLVRSDPGYSDQMCVRPDGYYVRYADYAALRSALDRSEARVATLKGALKPFSDACKYVGDDYADDYSPAWAEFFEIGQFRRARAALADKGGE